MTAQHITFIGAGNMASALIAGAVESGHYRAAHVTATDIRPDALAALREQHGIATSEDNGSAVAAADVLVLSVKPQTFAALLPTLAARLRSDALVISIAAGVQISVIERALGGKPRVVRVMPNTPALVGVGATAIAGGTHADEADLATAETLFASVGITERVEEALMDAVTALSGSGPAYVFRMIEALVDGAAAQGLPRDQALRLATQTVLGAATLLSRSDEDPATLRARVTSPGGTTEAGLQALTAHGFEDAITEAITSATARGRELGRAAAGSDD